MSRVWLGFSEANYTRGQEGPTHLQSTPPVPDVQSVLRSLESSCRLKSQLPPVRRRRLFKAKWRLVEDKAIFSNCLEVDHPMCRAGLLQRALSAECSANDKWGSRSPPPPPPPPRPMNEWQKSEHPGLCRCTVHPPKDFQPHSFQRR